MRKWSDHYRRIHPNSDQGPLYLVLHLNGKPVDGLTDKEMRMYGRIIVKALNAFEKARNNA